MDASSQHNVMSLMAAHVARSPHAPALRWVEPEAIAARQPGLEHGFSHSEITWAELDQRVREAATGLTHVGLGRGDRALIFVPMSVDLYVAMFAVFRIGAVAVFLDSFARQNQLDYCARLVEPKAYFGHQEAHGLRMMLPILGEIPLQIVTGGKDAPGAQRLDAVEAAGRAQAEVTLADVVPNDTALVTFTTGSSGTPKGANRTHGFLFAQHRALRAHLPYEPDDHDFPAFPIFLLNNLAEGVTTDIPAIDLARQQPHDAEWCTAQLLHLQVPCGTMSPALLRLVSEYAIEQGVELQHMRRMITGGAPVGPSTVQRFFEAAPNAELLILYGSTEAEPIAYITGSDMLRFLDSEAGFAEREGVCVGWLDESLQYRLVRLQDPFALDERGWAAWDVSGEAGELLVAGEHVCRDYYRDADASHRTKVVDGDVVWHRTGDVGRLDESGRLWLVGHVHNAILRGGTFVFPVKPEEVLRDLPFVRLGAYVGLPDPDLGERAVAAYAPGDKVLAGAVVREREAAIRSALDGAGIVVDDVVCMEWIPMDPRHHSKVDYDRLRAMIVGAD